ncbi:Vacuolar protein sorting-associated protein 53 [Tyrophagus putrescentiae]|nr:Vacuolar protein sorting-associated protein 53 [Tyrophagus putrescentiae]
MNISELVNNIFNLMLASKVSSSDFNFIEYINCIFSNQQSLSNFDKILRMLKEKIAFLDTEKFATSSASQKSVEENGRQTLKDAQTLILSLINVNKITCNIKQLDNAKRNLTVSIIMLNNLHILVQGALILKDTTEKRQNGAAAKTLQSIFDVLKHCSRFRRIQHILRLNVATPPLTSAQIHLLAEACLVLSISEPKYKRVLLAWFVDSELSEYRTLFAENQNKYLREYAHKILQAAIHRVGSAAGGSSGGVLSLGASLFSMLSSASEAARSLSTASSSAAAGLLQIFIKDLESRAYSVPKIV